MKTKYNLFEHKTKVVRNSIFVIVLTLSYSILRYNVFGNVSASDIPTLIINKSISFSLIIFLLLACVSRINNKVTEHKKYMLFTKIFIVIHVILSLCILSEKYYPKLFENTNLTIAGSASILFGALAMMSYFLKRNRGTILVFYLLIIFHLLFIGYKGWFDIGNWNGMMPPITLLCTLLLLVTIILVVYSIRKKSFETATAGNKTEQNKNLLSD